MTPRSRIAACLVPVALALVVVGGCKTASNGLPVVTTPPPSVEAFNELKARLAANPSARVGRVTEVLPSASLARIEEVSTADFPVTGGLVILDGSGSQVATAIVDRIDNNAVVVKYKSGSRAPEVGDAAVRFVD